MLIYRVRKTTSGFFVDTKDSDGHMIGSYLVKKGMTGYSCSCEAFAKTHNQYTHFHILVVKQWLKDGMSATARYTKGKDNKIQTLVE